ncbi:hypothetical protein HKX48_007920 [Thoreauomyces humboldtii]|nr:hypothetical protein HKX48_007920 [Thoreauomyces humboldtii]
MPSAEDPIIDSSTAAVAAEKKPQKRQHSETAAPKAPRKKRVAKAKEEPVSNVGTHLLLPPLAIASRKVPLTDASRPDFQTSDVPKPSASTNKHVPEIDKDVLVDLVKEHGQHWVVVCEEYNKSVGATPMLLRNRFRTLKKYAEDKWAREGGAVKNQETQPGNLYEEKEETDEVDEKTSDE